MLGEFVSSFLTGAISSIYPDRCLRVVGIVVEDQRQIKFGVVRANDMSLRRDITVVEPLRQGFQCTLSCPLAGTFHRKTQRFLPREATVAQQYSF